MEEMRKEFANISKNKASGSSPDLAPLIVLPQLSSLQSVDRTVGVDKYLHEWFLIKLVNLTKPLAYQTEEFLVRPKNKFLNEQSITLMNCLLTSAEHNSR